MSNPRNNAIESDDDLQAGDIIFFESRAIPTFSEKFVEFAQKLRGIKNPNLLHAAIVVGKDVGGRPLISHFTGSGHTVDRLDKLVFDDFPYRVMRPTDSVKAQAIADAANISKDNPAPDKPSKVGNYSALKMICSFLRGDSNFALKKERKKVANTLLGEAKKEEICSSFVARIIKKTFNTSDQKYVASSYLLPGNLFDNLEKSKQFNEIKLSPDARVEKENKNCKTMNQKFINILSKYGDRQKQIAKEGKGDVAQQNHKNDERIKLIVEAIKKNIDSNPQIILKSLMLKLEESTRFTSDDEKANFQKLLVSLALKAGIISLEKQNDLIAKYAPRPDKVPESRNISSLRPSS